VLSTLLESTSAINIKITPMDLQNAYVIFGPGPHCLEGKPQPSKGSYKSFDNDHEFVLKSDQLALHLNGESVKVAFRIPYELEKTAE
jgi:hypothetical protein